MRSNRVVKIARSKLAATGISLLLLVGCFSTTKVVFEGTHVKPKAFGPGANSKLKHIDGELKHLDKTYELAYENSHKTLTVKTFTGFGADRPKFDLWTDSEGNIHFSTAVFQKNQADATTNIFRHLVWAYMLSGAFDSLADLLGQVFGDLSETERLRIGAEKDVDIADIEAEAAIAE